MVEAVERYVSCVRAELMTTTRAEKASRFREFEGKLQIRSENGISESFRVVPITPASRGVDPARIEVNGSSCSEM